MEPQENSKNIVLNFLWGNLHLFLIVGVLYQFISLLFIDKLEFFSWTQIFSDTVIYISLIGVVYFGGAIGHIITKKKGKSWLFMSILIAAFWLSGTYYLTSMYRISLVISSLIGVLLGIIGWINNSLEKNNIVRVFLVGFIVIIVIALAKPYNFYKVSIKEEGSKIRYNIEYINDSYIFVNEENNHSTIVFPIKGSDIGSFNIIVDENRRTLLKAGERPIDKIRGTFK